MSDLLIQNARVLLNDGTQVTIVESQDILISGNRIQAIQPTGEADPSHFREVIPADGMLAMPGLINTHSHVPMVIFRGLAEDVDIVDWFNQMWALEANLTPEDVYWGMLLGLAEMIEAGVTAVADHYWHMDQAARAVEQAGTRALLGWAMFGSHGQEAIDRTADYVRTYQGAANGRIRTIMAPHAPYTCDDDFLRATVKAAEALGVGIHIHASENAQQVEDSLRTRGKTPIAVLRDTGMLDQPTILAHICGATPEDVALLAKYPTGIAHCPKTYLKLAMGLTPVVELREAGVPVGLGTDGAVSNNTLDIWESMRLMAMTQKSQHGTPTILPRHEVLDIALRGSAEVYGQPDELGALVAGHLADVILVDLTATHHQPLYDIPASLIYSARASDVQTVICDGRVLMRDRVLLTLDRDEIVSHVREAMDRLQTHVPGVRIQSYR